MATKKSLNDSQPKADVHHIFDFSLLGQFEPLLPTADSTSRCIVKKLGGSRGHRMSEQTWQSWTNTMNYALLTREQRYQIHALRRQDMSCARIGAEVGCHASTVSSELKRNAGKRGLKLPPFRGHFLAERKSPKCLNPNHPIPQGFATRWSNWYAAVVRPAICPKNLAVIPPAS
jgi:hypothetical protein